MQTGRVFCVAGLFAAAVMCGAAAQLWTEDFENGTKGAYAAGDVTCTMGSWRMDDALIGSLADDRFFDCKSVRIRNSGFIAMNFDKTDGAGEISVYFAKYGTNPNATGKIEYSTDSGVSWTQAGDTVAVNSTTLTQVTRTLFPKWPFDKFVGASRRLGTQMKATGEVMAIGTNFESALLKAVRGAEIHLDTLHAKPLSDRPVRDRLADCDDHRLFTVFEALCSGVSIDEIHDITRIDRWFLARLQNLVDYEASIRSGLTPELYQLIRNRFSGARTPARLPVRVRTQTGWNRSE